MSSAAGVERVILFGSRAKGTAQPRSDVDLAVEAPGADVRAWDRVLTLAEEADSLLLIDVVRLDRASADFRDEILAEGVTLYARPHA
ncbi:MAG: nucleotidyltransferase domain-containing protein [Dehalococcoidia bacterium]